MISFIYDKYRLILKLAPNALQAAALRDLADFIFDFRFYFSSHNHLSLPTNPALWLPARWLQCIVIANFLSVPFTSRNG
jgi:hypothetical protein